MFVYTGESKRCLSSLYKLCFKDDNKDDSSADTLSEGNGVAKNVLDDMGFQC